MELSNESEGCKNEDEDEKMNIFLVLAHLSLHSSSQLLTSSSSCLYQGRKINRIHDFLYPSPSPLTETLSLR